MFAATVFVGPEIDWLKISPLLVMLGGALFLILAGSLTSQWKPGVYGAVAAFIAVASAACTAWQWNELGDGASSELLANALYFGRFSLFATFSIAIATALAVLVATDYLV